MADLRANAATLKAVRKSDPFKIFLRILYAVSLTVYLYFLLKGLGYYQTAYLDRPHHSSYRLLRPAGFAGQGFGILGSTMMLLMLLYSLRKRARWMRNWGSLSRWLDIHIYFGVMGPLFIILHTTFKVGGLIAVSFWSMIAVAGSGVLGRYLYLQIPRNRRGDELTLQEIDAMNRRFNEDLQEELFLDEDKIARMEEMGDLAQLKKRGILALMGSLAASNFLRPFVLYRLKGRFASELGLSGSHAHRAAHLFYQRALLQQRILLLNEIQRYFHYWHVFHKPFAIIMYLIMFVHIGVAVWLGYTWIF